MTAEQEHRLGARAAVVIIAALCALCVLASCKLTYKTLPSCDCAQRDRAR